mmetsp:Transcript_24243/g.78964  ORF Transcript_24243/g.78964 Transcript_24243/m.78964 type:complete len:703 (+) Transcript_24243:134-2242(+)
MGKEGSKRSARKAKSEEIAMLKELDAEAGDDATARAAAKLSAKPVIDNGATELFEKKLSKEEKKELAAKKKAEREARKAAAAGEAGSGDAEACAQAVPTTARAGKRAAETLADKVKREQALLDEELEAARIGAVRIRNAEGAFLGQLEAREFSMPNPGGGPDLLDKASYTLQRGGSYALVGRNGCGKSTLLKAMASRRVGAIHPAVTVHYVSQEVELTDRTLSMTPLDLVVHADLERRLLIEERDALIAAEAKGEPIDGERLQGPGGVLEQLQLLDAETAHTRADQLLANLGFSDELRQRPLSALSGGWRVRTMLAAALFGKPDMLLLDEPTNHLSIGAVLWLMRELTTSPAWSERIVVVVSHDRVFLDAVATDVLHLSAAARRLTQSHGNYATWAKRREQQQKTFERATALRAEQVAKLKTYANHGFKYGGSDVSRQKMKERQAEKLEAAQAELEDEAAALQEDHELPLSLQAGGEISGPLVQLRGVAFGYSAAGEQLFSGAELGVDATSRIVLLGENGNGKTTLVKLLLGDLAPTAGEVVSAGGVRIALVNQHHADQIDLTLTPLQFLMDRFPGDGSYAHEQALRSHLATCGVLEKQQAVPSSALSGGQRSRVALAAVSYAAPHVLVLDEPTNNLDLESIAALADCVTAFKGGVVLVSHDQYFVSRVANEVWVVEGGQVKRAASFDAFRKQQLTKLQPVD